MLDFGMAYHSMVYLYQIFMLIHFDIVQPLLCKNGEKAAADHLAGQGL